MTVISIPAHPARKSCGYKAVSYAGRSNPVIEPVSVTEPGTKFTMQGRARRPSYRLAETNPETRRECESPYSGRKSLTISGRSGRFRTCDLCERGLLNAANDLSGLIRKTVNTEGTWGLCQTVPLHSPYGVRFRTNVHFCAFLPERFPDFRVMPLRPNKSAGEYSVRQPAQATL